MANENEEIKNAVSGTTEEHKHHTWIGDVIEKVEDVLENMDTDFPLSGGEEHAVHHHEHHHSEENKEGDAPKNEAHHKSLLDNLIANENTEFPLSGGE